MIVRFFVLFLQPHLWHTEVPRLGVERIRARGAGLPRATAMQDPSCVCKLYRRSWQSQILNPLSKPYPHGFYSGSQHAELQRELLISALSTEQQHQFTISELLTVMRSTSHSTFQTQQSLTLRIKSRNSRLGHTVEMLFSIGKAWSFLCIRKITLEVVWQLAGSLAWRYYLYNQYHQEKRENAKKEDKY